MDAVVVVAQRSATFDDCGGHEARRNKPVFATARCSCSPLSDYAAVRVVRGLLWRGLRRPSTSMDNPETNGETVTLFVKMPNGQTAVLHDIAPSCDIEELHHLLQAAG